MSEMKEGLLTSHWLLFKPGTREVVGCHCGFDPGCDCDGCRSGDSVLAHVGAEAIREAVLAWAEMAPDDGKAFNRAEVADVLFRHADSLERGPQ